VHEYTSAWAEILCLPCAFEQPIRASHSRDDISQWTDNTLHGELLPPLRLTHQQAHSIASDSDSDDDEEDGDEGPGHFDNDMWVVGAIMQFDGKPPVGVFLTLDSVCAGYRYEVKWWKHPHSANTWELPRSFAHNPGLLENFKKQGSPSLAFL
jgi:hypothetical protein